MIQQLIPVLPAINIRDTIMFYESKLGFTAIDEGSYVIMKKNNIELHFFLCNDKKLCENSSCYIKVSDIEYWFTKLTALNIVTLNGKLQQNHRGVKEFSIRDNNGNLLKFAKDTSL